MLIAFVVAWLAGTVAADPEIVKLWDHPKRLSFNFEQIALSEAASTIAKGFGADSVSVEGGERKVNFEAREVTFFEALDALAEQNRLVLVGWPGRPDTKRERGEQPIHLARESKSVRRTAVAHPGPTRISIGSTESTLGFVKIELVWLAAKELEEAAVIEVLVESATGDEDIPLTLKPKRTFGGNPRSPDNWPHYPNTSFELEFDPGYEGPTRIKVLSGKLRVVLPVRYGEVTFDATKSDQTAKLGASTITFRGLTQEPLAIALTVNAHLCRLLAERFPFGPWLWLEESARHSAVPVSGIRVIARDERGEVIRRGGGWDRFRLSRHPPWEHTLDVAAPPRTVQLQAVTEVALREVPFRLENIALKRRPGAIVRPVPSD